MTLSPVISGKSNKARARWEKIIRKSNKGREITVKDKAHHSTLEHVRIQRIIMQSVGTSIAQHSILERVCIQIMSTQAA